MKNISDKHLLRYQHGLVSVVQPPSDRMNLYLCFPLLLTVLHPALCLYNCSSEYDRTPDNSDLIVDCGTSTITLEINLCTAQWAGFNTSDLALNGNHNNSDCKGSVDTTVNPPIVRYQLPVNHSLDNPCRQSLQIVDEIPDPSGPFSSFLSIQSVIITGFIDTPRSDQGVISYSTDLYYHFSCRYPLEYLINNTQIVASSVSVATSDRNGTFIDTLQMAVFNDSDYGYPLVVPSTGLELRTRIYVEVKAVNLTGNFHILLDHCFSTPTPYNISQSEQHNFFTGCSVDQRTSVSINGLSKSAKFNFEAFRFVQHHNQAKSSIYLHCILRLCEPSKCEELLSSCSSRRKRSVIPFGEESKESATVSVGPLYTAQEGNDIAPEKEDLNVTGLVVGVVFGSAAAAMLVLGGWFVLKKLYWTGRLRNVLG
ncbi:zona pellucida-like domain-containing protein 1 [Echeneis naucrates]|uniref:zona pellucida-like domain-containing protein 1 n=1 Tax=Echeneis naucrates TaxID=173247 RepID=UPI0011135978|nr:zona pellucida-like domain-containing protein 1 [Echeneis naucrates]